MQLAHVNLNLVSVITILLSLFEILHNISFAITLREKVFH